MLSNPLGHILLLYIEEYLSTSIMHNQQAEKKITLLMIHQKKNLNCSRILLLNLSIPTMLDITSTIRWLKLSKPELWNLKYYGSHCNHNYLFKIFFMIIKMQLSLHIKPTVPTKTNNCQASAFTCHSSLTSLTKMTGPLIHVTTSLYLDWY